MKDQATKDGVLADVLVSPPTTLPFPHESFDIVVIPLVSGGGLAGTEEAFRVLRPGGRLSVIARAADAAISSELQQRGFKAARLIAECSSPRLALMAGGLGNEFPSLKIRFCTPKRISVRVVQITRVNCDHSCTSCGRPSWQFSSFAPIPAVWSG